MFVDQHRPLAASLGSDHLIFRGRGVWFLFLKKKFWWAILWKNIFVNPGQKKFWPALDEKKIFWSWIHVLYPDWWCKIHQHTLSGLMSRNSSLCFIRFDVTKFIRALPNILTGKPAFLQKNIPGNLPDIFEGTKHVDELCDINPDKVCKWIFATKIFWWAIL